MARLGDVCEILNGYAFKSDQYVEEGIRIIRIANVQKGYIEDSAPVFYPYDSKDAKKYILEEGDMLLSLTGNVGRVAKLSKEFLPAALNQRVACLRIKNGVVLDKAFLFNLLNSDYFEQQCIAASKGVAQKNMSTEWLKEYEIPLMPLEQQQAIATVLDKVSELIALRKEQLAKLDQLVKSRFIELFGDGCDERFLQKSLPQIIIKDKHALKRGPFGGALKKDDFVESGYLVYEQRHAIHNDFAYEKYYISPTKYQEMIAFKVEPGDLIISCSGVTLGRIAEIPVNAKKGIINQALLKVSLDQSIMTNTFFVHQFRSERIQDILFGFCRGSGIPNFPSMNEVKAVQFICPPIELQQQFAAFVEQTDKSKLVIQQGLDKLEFLKKSLMQEYFG